MRTIAGVKILPLMRTRRKYDTENWATLPIINYHKRFFTICDAETSSTTGGLTVSEYVPHVKVADIIF